MVALRVSFNKEDVLVIKSYCTKSKNVTNFKSLIEVSNLLLQKYRSDNVVLMGDLYAEVSL